MKTKLLSFLFCIALTTISAQQNIIGGNNTTIGENPWQVSLRSTNTYHIVEIRNQHLCGGSILSPTWILTAAHCVTNRTTGAVIGINEITVTGGITMRNDAGQLRLVAEIVRHPNYNAQTLENDVALIRLTAPLNFNVNVRPILLTNSTNLANVGITGTVTGWGNTLDGTANTAANQLQILTMPIISRTQANNLTGPNVSNNMIPLLRPGTGVAPGDSGGPLSVVSNGTRYLIGCSSWGEFPKDQKPTIYTNLFNYRAWILARVPEPTLTTPDCVCSTPNTPITLTNGNAATVTWQSSTNITILTSNANGATIRAISGTRGSGWVTATFNGITLRRDLWVGEPNAPSTLSGPSQVLTGALVNYNSSVAPGATSYEWRLPYPFTTITGSWDINSSRWQMRPTTIRNLTAFTGTGKISGLVQVWGKNKCGNGGAKTMSVSHSNSGGGGAIPFTANISGLDEAPKEDAFYPNPADMDLNIHIAERDSYGEISITLISIDGKIVFTSNNKNVASIPTSHLPSGNYILNVRTDRGNKSKNIIVKH
jgi:secreted trypsin-like serine protease